MSYETNCLAWGDGTYRPDYASASATSPFPWPAPPATGASGADWAAWIDTNAGTIAPNGYRVWQADPAHSGGTGQHKKPPRPPQKD